MNSFIFDVLQHLRSQDKNLSSITFVLPSKRAGVFLRHELSRVVNKTIFAPAIISIEDFVAELAQLKTISNTELLFEFYETYVHLTPKADRDPFEAFSKWAQILLQDFNEIDRYLIPQNQIFEYLSAIKELEHWSLQPNKTEVVSNYVKFWNKLKLYYNNYTQTLIEKKIGYQGLIYREAVENIQSYINSNSKKSHVFLGFNALNTAEETIIQELLQSDMAEIFWDIDQAFLDNPIHDAALFTRQHKANWNYFKTHDFNWISNHYRQEKAIEILGIPKNIGQAKAVGSLLSSLAETDPSLNSTAVVLGDESLLIPVLNSIPSQIDAINITMGFQLSSIPLASLFELLFNLHKKNTDKYYYKDVIAILSHQFIRPLFFNEEKDIAAAIIGQIQKNNTVFLSHAELRKQSGQHTELIDILFSNWNNKAQTAIANGLNLIACIKAHLSEDKERQVLALEYLFRFNSLFNELFRLNEGFRHLNDISALFSVYKELLSSETLDFQGEPLQGLQIMGMLESRVLDFETLIITSVNEGVLPSGKSNNSFIPFDVKLENKLPTYKEKDAVYTYHFYRLLQRAKRVYILYNTEVDVLTGGEKSRFITQLELENHHKIKQHIITPQVPIIKTELKRIHKTTAIIEQLKTIAKSGFSPSSLTNYMRNPMDFYYQKLLGIKEQDEVEETVAANTMGTVVHDTLEILYTPYVGRQLTLESLEQMKPQIGSTVSTCFQKTYATGDLSQGKNLIIFEIAKRYVLNFINHEIQDVKQGNSIKIVALEAKNSMLLSLPELDFEVCLKGTVDRVDEYNGMTRIIDYKTGKVDQNQVEIVDWESLTTDYKKYSKSFQILCYAYMMHSESPLNFPIEAGIISFKNMNSGFLKFTKKDKLRYGNKDTMITQDSLEHFDTALKKLIIEICDHKIDFIEKEV